MESYSSGNFLKKYTHTYKTSKWNYQVMGKTKFQHQCYLPPNKFSSTRNVIHLIELLTKGAPEKPTTQAMSTSCSPQTDGKILLLKTIFTQLINHRKVKLVSTWILQHYWLAFMVLKVLGTLSEEKCSTDPATNTIIYKGILLACYARAIVAQKMWD